MRHINVKKVETASEMRDFIRLPRRIYKGNLYYVPDLDNLLIDVWEVFFYLFCAVAGGAEDGEHFFADVALDEDFAVFG